MDFGPILDEIASTLRPQAGQQGHVASYIPALARVRGDQFGIALVTRDGIEATAGDADTLFSIQSVSKVFSLTLCLQGIGEELWQRVGLEPSGNPFNSLVQLESEQGKPRNPFINAGAIVIADGLVGLGCSDRDLVAMLSDLSGEPVDIDEEVAASEAESGFRNQALAYFMKSFGRIQHDVPRVLDLYFRQCAIRMNCRQLARAAGYLCRDGAHPKGGPAVVNDRLATREFGEAVRATLNPGSLVPTSQSLGGEDFAWYLETVPGAMARLGTRTPGGPTYDLHQGDLRVDERATLVAAKVLAAAAVSAPIT